MDAIEGAGGPGTMAITTGVGSSLYARQAATVVA
jgi:hypothetical protein